ncbi:MAG: hypothetical protein ACLT98_18225 [Eggerthellaceae bacterium]
MMPARQLHRDGGLPEVGLVVELLLLQASRSGPITAGARAAIGRSSLVGGKEGYRYIRQRLREREDPIVVWGKTVRRLMAEEGCRVSYAKKSAPTARMRAR